jgi:hypothetical protein
LKREDGVVQSFEELRMYTIAL